MRFLLCLIVLTRAGAFVNALPSYQTAAQNWEMASNKVNLLAPPSDVSSRDLPTDAASRHYGLLLAVVLELAQELSLNCGLSKTYDSYYDEAVQKAVSSGWGHPHRVTMQLRDILDDVEVQVNPLLELLKTCKPTDEHACDELVQAVIDGDPEQYEEQAQLLLVAGDLAAEYLKNTFEKEAQELEVVKLLATGKEQLRELVVKGTAVGRTLHQLNGDIAKCYKRNKNVYL